MKINTIKAEWKKINLVFFLLVGISILVSAGVMNLIYFYDHKVADVTRNVLNEYIYTQSFLSAQLKLVMPLIVIIFAAYVWTIDLESGCVKYNFLATGRKRFARNKVIVCLGVTVILYLLLVAGLGIFYELLLKDTVLFSKGYWNVVGWMALEAISNVVWILIVGIISIEGKGFGNTVAISIVIFCTFYVLGSYFPKYLYLMPSSAVITIWGYGAKKIIVRNIVNVVCYTAVLTVALVKIIKKKEV